MFVLLYPATAAAILSYCSFSVLRVVSYLPVSCFLGVASTTWGPFLHPLFTPQPPSFFDTQNEKNMQGECEARTALHCRIIQGQLTYSAICRHRREGSLGSLLPVDGDLCGFKLFTHSLWREAGILQMLPHVKQASTWWPCPALVPRISLWWKEGLNPAVRHWISISGSPIIG